MTWSPLMALRDLFVSRAEYRAQTKSSTNVNKSIIIFAAGRAWISHLFCFLLVFLLAFLRSAGRRRGKVFLWVNARPGLGLNDVYNLRQQSHASASRLYPSSSSLLRRSVFKWWLAELCGGQWDVDEAFPVSFHRRSVKHTIMLFCSQTKN